MLSSIYCHHPVRPVEAGLGRAADIHAWQGADAFYCSFALRLVTDSVCRGLKPYKDID